MIGARHCGLAQVHTKQCTAVLSSELEVSLEQTLCNFVHALSVFANFLHAENWSEIKKS